MAFIEHFTLLKKKKIEKLYQDYLTWKIESVSTFEIN